MKDKKTFGSFIKEKRIIKHYSQKELADLLYVTESAVSKWERGVTYPDITLISALCKVLEVNEKELIETSDDTEYRKLKKDSEKYNRIKKALFWSLNIFYALGIFTCFIVNLAVSHTLSWFFIVLTSVLVTSSVESPTAISEIMANIESDKKQTKNQISASNSASEKMREVFDSTATLDNLIDNQSAGIV